MLFVARSPSFIQTTRLPSVAVAYVTEAARAVQLPWLVLTYLLPDEPPDCSFETACTQHIDVLLEHMKDRPTAQLASLIYMEPPSLNDKWTRLRVDFILRGKYQGKSVYLYHVPQKGLLCLGRLDVDPDDVKQRKHVLRVDSFRHFNN